MRCRGTCGNTKLGRYVTRSVSALSSIYSRDIQKWLLIAPLIGLISGLLAAGLTLIILNVLWAPLLAYYLRHRWAIIPGLLAGFLVAGLIMQFLTPDPNEHSTEEIIRSYHEHGGKIQLRYFWPKLAAAVATVGLGGSAALEGPSIYGGGAIGSWLWLKLERFGLEPADRPIMLISGAAAGMGAVFRAPLTGLVFALEMPYRDDLAHEALLPSLIASVVAYAVFAVLVGAQPLFSFVGIVRYSAANLAWSALLGVFCGLAAMVYASLFRWARRLAVRMPISHVAKMLGGGLGTALCGLLFTTLYGGSLIPLGANYEAARIILSRPTPYSGSTLVVFAGLKLLATLFSLGAGGVSAMFVPLFLAGGALGTAFAKVLVKGSACDLYASVGMASFLAAGYKTPLAAVVFVSETTGSHPFIIPSLIGAAFAYATSGDVSVSGEQHLHEEAARPRSEHADG